MLLSKVKDTIKKYNLIQKNDKIVVGVSGGPDSVTLLHLLCSLKKEFNLKLHVAHLDHGLRKDSSNDRLFVESLAQRLNLPFTSARVSIKELARKGSLEEIARNVRLGFLFKVAKDSKAQKIALGHNLDDQAETVLMRILRGTGLYGLSGILAKRDLYGYEIIRPLILTKRKEIEAYLKQRKIKARTDSTNLKDLYLRNRIRNKLLPFLEKGYNRNIREVLSNTAESLAYDYDYLAKAAAKYAKGPGGKIELKRLMRLHPSIRRLVIRLFILKVKGDTRRISFQHIREIEDMISNRPLNSVVDLPKGISVKKQKKALYFYHS
jgi:tRNA(Ile)-lysidine synthase